MLHPLIIYRGVNQKEPLSRDHFVSQGFVSTSVHTSTALGFTNRSHGVLIQIEIPAGSHVMFVGEYSNHPLEGEIMLPHGAHFTITKEPWVGMFMTHSCKFRRYLIVVMQ